MKTRRAIEVCDLEAKVYSGANFMVRKNYKLKNMRITVIFIDDQFLQVYNF